MLIRDSIRPIDVLADQLIFSEEVSVMEEVGKLKMSLSRPLLLERVLLTSSIRLITCWPPLSI